MCVRGNPRGRLRWFAATALSLVGLVVMAIPAGAQSSYQESVVGSGVAPSAFTTNIPYVAWRGEQVRAVKCSWDLADQSVRTRFQQGANIDVLVESWSGGSRDPQLERSTVDQLFWSSDGTPCVRFDMVSSDAGLARVKLVVSDRDHNPIMKHQFLMIWLSLGAATIDEVGANDPTGQQPAGSHAAVGDPLGDGNLTAGSANGRVQVNVTGTFPHPLATGGTFTLPNDWATIANALATDNDPFNTNKPLRWDIHDDQGAGENHVSGFCSTNLGASIDAVDNCNGGGDLGPFSNVFGQGVTAGGPFDPARPATLLSNGMLDANDAPMPATRVDIAIAPNSGAAGDTSGSGALVKSDKSDVYSRDGNGSSTAHNLYAPYYVQWIPATGAAGAGYPEASGVDGPAQGNNFEGFLVNGPYDNWDTFALKSVHSTDTACNAYVGNTPARDVKRVTPSGDQTVAVYTDEHGEAQVAYKPYAGGFYFDQLPVVLNRNRGCDLQDVRTLGTASISAVARYPYQPVDAAPVATASITKTVSNLFDKSLSYWPKGLGAANNNARIVVAHANDIDGTPYANEKVCFNVAEQADGLKAYTGDAGPLDAPFTVGGGWAKTEPGSDICRTLDSNGNAAIEIFNSDPQQINVVAEYVTEGLLRSIDVDFATPGSSGGSNPGPGTVPKPAAGAGSNPPSLAQIQDTAPAKAATLSKSVKRKARSTRRISLTQVRFVKGRLVLMVRVLSKNKSERIRIRIGKRSVLRRVRSNHLVRVANVTLPSSGDVRVSLG